MPVGVGELEHGIQRGIEPARIDLRDDRLAGVAGELEHVPVVRPIDAPVDDDGQRHLLRVLEGVVGLLLEALRQRVQGERHAVGNQLLVARGEQMDARPGVRLRAASARPTRGSSPSS